MKQKGSRSGVLITVLVVFVVLLVGSVAFLFGKSEGATEQQALAGEETALTETEQAQALASCGSDKKTTVTLDLKNTLNDSASEIFDATYYVYKVNADSTESFVLTGTDSTAGSISLLCGSKYVLKFVTDGSADNSRAQSIYTNNAEINKDGEVVFTTTEATMTLGVVGSKHSTIEVRSYDENDLARMYATDGSNSAYQADGVIFHSTTDNLTNTTVTAGSSFMQTIYLRATDSVGDFNDYGVLVMFDATASYWTDVMSVSFDGVELSKAVLDDNEDKATSDYEYVYLIPAGVLVDDATHKLSFEIKKDSGATGSNLLQIDLVSRGAYLSKDGYNVYTGAYKDSATNPAVYTAFDINYLVD